jgi:uncharacterized Zn finger protein (UPF0148 family)
MVALFGPSEQDLERLRSTVENLGTTSVPGLAAALAWRERKAEKLLAHELARPNTRLAYDPARRVVKWTRLPALVAPEAPREQVTPIAVPRVARAPSPVLAGTTLKTLCPSCHVALIPTGSASLAVCPQCGRLASPRGGITEASPPASSVAPANPASTPAPGTPTDLTDRRSQEMFAAYVTSKPIPCPKCRTPLRHRGPSEYICPSCAQTVQFGKLGPAAGPAPPIAPPA